MKEKEEETTLRTIIIKLPKINDKEKTFKSARDFHFQPRWSNRETAFKTLDIKAIKGSERNHR